MQVSVWPSLQFSYSGGGGAGWTDCLPVGALHTKDTFVFWPGMLFKNEFLELVFGAEKFPPVIAWDGFEPKNNRSSEEIAEWDRLKAAVECSRGAIQEFYGAIPDDIWQEVIKYKIGGTQRWLILKALSCHSSSIDLSRRHPGIFFMLVYDAFYRGTKKCCVINPSSWHLSGGDLPPLKNPMEYIAYYAPESPSEILGAMRWEQPALLLEIFEKMPTSSIDAFSILYMRDIREPLLSMIKSLERINATVLWLIGYNEYHARDNLTFELLNEIGADDLYARAGCNYVSEIMENMGQMTRGLGLNYIPITSLMHMKARYDELCELIIQKLPAFWPTLPPCQNPDLIPIDTAQGLLAEERELRHGVINSYKSIADGSVALFRVEKPVRGTLFLTKDEDGWGNPYIRLLHGRSGGLSLSEELWSMDLA